MKIYNRIKKFSDRLGDYNRLSMFNMTATEYFYFLDLRHEYFQPPSSHICDTIAVPIRISTELSFNDLPSFTQNLN